jgi:hypothetical protein
MTKLAGPFAGVFYYAYVRIDLFSRYVDRGRDGP